MDCVRVAARKLRLVGLGTMAEGVAVGIVLGLATAGVGLDWLTGPVTGAALQLVVSSSSGAKPL